MDGTQGGAFKAVSSGETSAKAWQPAVVDPVRALVKPVAGLRAERLEDIESLVITKTVPGFDEACIAALRSVVAEAAAGRLGRLKFLVFDFAHEGFPLALAADGFDALMSELANLILAAPVVSIAAARANLAGADLEFALGCSMLVGEAGRRFSFAGDAAVSVGVYGLLSQKLGFVRAERLMETGDILTAAQMHELLLLKEEIEGVDAFVRKTARRHNACYGIYRAQRMAVRSVHDSLRA